MEEWELLQMLNASEQVFNSFRKILHDNYLTSFHEEARYLYGADW
jgi:hypothetical protein